MNREQTHLIRPLAACAAILAAGLTIGPAPPVAADMTVVGRYVFINGDTATRSSAYTSRRSRMTGPDGREFIYDTKSGMVTVIDHKAQTYWKAPITVADSLASERLMEMRRELKPQLEANRERWVELMQVLDDSTKVEMTGEFRPIAGYSCSKWVLTMGPYLRYERWVTPALGLADYAPELEKVILSSALDPLGRLLLKRMFDMRGKDVAAVDSPTERTGQDDFALASVTRFQTLTQQGSFSWEATEIRTAKIPGSVWETPKGYRQIAP